MHEANVCLVGTVISDPIKRVTPGGEDVVNFRMASNARRYDPTKSEWVENGTLYATVNCWRRLVKGVSALGKGDPVMALGQLRTTQYVNKDGIERSDLELRATAVGPDLSRCTVKVDRPKPVAEPTAETEVAMAG